MDKWNYMKIKSFYTIKEMVSKLKRFLNSHRMEENLC
jgi:hypothetical protein